MNETVTQAFATTVEALRSTPVLLSILVFNMGFMALVGWLTYHSGEKWEKIFELVVKCQQ